MLSLACLVSTSTSSALHGHRANAVGNTLLAPNPAAERDAYDQPERYPESLMATSPTPDREELAAKALAYYDSADPNTMSSNDSTTGEKYSVLDAAAALAAALRLFVQETPVDDTRALLSRLGVDFREGVDDEGEPAFYLLPQYISRDDEEGASDE